jgi:Tfp pilus assembly PilM family ATPase
MSNNVAGMGTRLSAIAITEEETQLKAVELGKQGGAFEVLWTKTSEVGRTDRRLFAAECGLSVKPTGQAKTDGAKTVVVGFDSAGVAFYRIGVPVAKEEEVAAMVRLQAEARLPLPAEQMELTWRAGKRQDGQMAVTIAAARKEYLRGFAEDMRSFGPTKILLGSEGIVKAWRAFFSGNDRSAVVVSIGSRNTQVCLAEDGMLINAVSLDTRMRDFSAEQGVVTEQTETTERFTQDMRSVLELFGYAEPAKVPVFVLSDGSSVIESIVSYLGSAGLNAAVALPEIYKFKAQMELNAEDIYEYRVPIGLAMMTLEARAEELNIFEHIYNPAGEGKKRCWLYSPKAACTIAAVMLIGLVIVAYAVDVASPNAIRKRLRASASDINVSQLTLRQKLMKTVARERPDLLQLINEININDSGGILLDSVDFKKGRPVTISGQAPGTDQLYKFQATLLSKKSITSVIIKNASKDAKSKKLKFTLTFHYKSFTK